jgi:hypothetical protein
MPFNGLQELLLAMLRLGDPQIGDLLNYAASGQNSGFMFARRSGPWD